jgi:Carboxypeptidase regulatory-like domain
VLVIAVGVFLLSYLLTVPASTQTYALSGKVSDLAGHAVPTATVTAKSVRTGHSFTAVTNSDGMYSIRNLAGGDSQVSAVAGELQAPPIKVTLAAAQTTDLTLSPTPRSSAKPRSIGISCSNEYPVLSVLLFPFLPFETRSQSFT